MITLLWLDLETTSTDENHDHVLEVAAATASLDDACNITHRYRTSIFYEDVLVQFLDPYVKDMHTKNGLLNECVNSDTKIEMAEDALLEFVPVIEDSDERVTLAGSSVHFDLRFIRRWMPRLARRLSHRILDVSSIKLENEGLGMPRIQKGNAHRAKDDIEESVAHLKMCREWRSEFHSRIACVPAF